MAPVQQTFSVIPELPKALANGSDTANARSSKPPMTTKQAKKLYKAATKVPKLSKAEQRRQDLMEQDRIRREFEKERNQARAKTARDKKKEKEEKEKADKKRKGLPLKEVHPSQDTLARFMRPLKPPKKVEEDPKPPPSPSPPSLPHSARDDESDDTSPIGDVLADDDDDRPVKRQKLEEPIEQAVDAVPCDQSPSASPKGEAQEEAAPELPAVEVETAEEELPLAQSSDRAPDDMKTEDQIGKCNASESFSADDGLDDEDFSALFIDVAPNPEPGPVKAPELRQNQLLPEPRDPSEPPELAPRLEKHVHPPATTRDAIDSCDSIGSRTQLPKVDVPPRETQKADKDARDRPPAIGSVGLAEPTVLGPRDFVSWIASRSHTSSCPSMDSGSKTAHSNLAADMGSATKRPLSAGVSSRQAPVARRESPPVPQTTRQPLNTSNAKSANLTTTPKMAPPPLPPRLQSSRFESSGLAGSRPRFSPGAATDVMTNNYTPGQDKPANEHMPPSSTQLFLFDNLDDLFPSPSQEVQEIFEKPRVARNRTETRQQPYPPPRLHPSATVAKMRNSPVTPQLSSIRQPMRRPFPAGRMVSSISPAKPKHIDVLRAPLQSHGQCSVSDEDFPFLSTQDFFMSSQDIRELEDDTSSPIKPSNPPGQIDCRQPTSKTLSPKHNGSRTAIKNPDSQATGSEVVPHVQTPDLDRQAATGVQAQLPHPFKAPMDPSSQASSLPDTPSLPRRNIRAPQSRFMHPRATPRSSANGVAPDEQRSSCSNPFRFFKTAGNGTPRPSPGFQSAKTVAVAEPIEAAPSQPRETPPRPSPKPFFTSSGTRELTFLAIERSKRTAREDLHARRKADEELAKQEKSKRPRETTHNEPKVPTREIRPPSDHDIIDDDDDDDYELDEILLASDLVKDPVSNRNTEPLANNAAKRESNQTKSQHRKNPVAAMPAQNKARGPDEKKPESAVQSKPKSLSSYEKMLELAARQRNGPDQGGKRIEPMSEESNKENREQDIPPTSQGTDYGDATWDMTDLDLDFL
ncbi:hypothetical protein PG985_000497 [Apiospora marii]|uniref:Inner centromere protein ARK-binding domain-containing protein n=1 Tax=Apiospora marii TaxID=335849 RepID=A0ABR1R2F6_9PEZI